MKRFIIFCFAVLLSAAFVGFGCGGKSYKAGGVKYKVKKDKIVERSYGKSRDAKYFYKQPHVKKNGNIYVMGSVDVPGDSSPARCTMAADLQARVELAGELNTRLENQLQYASEGFSIDASSLKQIASQSTKIEFLQGVYIDERFWEKRLVQSGPDTYIKYTCYSRVVMPLDKFQQQTDRLLKNHEKKGEFTPEFQKAVDAQWNNFFKPVEVDDNTEYAIEYLENIQ